MKTYKEWMESSLNFRDYVKPEDEVDPEMVNYFTNELPPRSHSFGYLQVGEPICGKIDTDGKCKPVYLTFSKEVGKWIYKGCCFAGKTQNMKEE